VAGEECGKSNVKKAGGTKEVDLLDGLIDRTEEEKGRSRRVRDSGEAWKGRQSLCPVLSLQENSN